MRVSRTARCLQIPQLCSRELEAQPRDCAGSLTGHEAPEPMLEEPRSPVWMDPAEGPRAREERLCRFCTRHERMGGISRERVSHCLPSAAHICSQTSWAARALLKQSPSPGGRLPVAWAAPLGIGLALTTATEGTVQKGTPPGLGPGPPQGHCKVPTSQPLAEFI